MKDSLTYSHRYLRCGFLHHMWQYQSLLPSQQEPLWAIYCMPSNQCSDSTSHLPPNRSSTKERTPSHRGCQNDRSTRTNTGIRGHRHPRGERRIVYVSSTQLRYYYDAIYKHGRLQGTRAKIPKEEGRVLPWIPSSTLSAGRYSGLTLCHASRLRPW